MTPSGDVRAGRHGFTGGKSGTVLLGPGVHDIRIDYIQVPAAPRPTCDPPLSSIRVRTGYRRSAFSVRVRRTC